MMARDRRYGKSPVKTRVGIATAILVGGAVAAGAVLASSHGAASTATSAAYSSTYNSEWTMLNSAMNSWGSSRQTSYTDLTRATQGQQFSQNWHHGRMLVAQRGIVVLVTHRFLILRSANGSFHLWLLSGNTRFQNVSNTMAGAQALAANAGVTQQMMTAGNMVPITGLLAGSPTTAATMLTPTPAAQTVTVQVANTNLTVTVTVTRTTATINQTATTPLTGLPTWNPTTFTQNAWMPVNNLARGDLALVVGTRSHWTLKAQLILFVPLSTSDIGGGIGTGTTGTTTGTTGTTGTSTGTTGTTGTGNGFVAGSNSW
jgi:hypothetical protein